MIDHALGRPSVSFRKYQVLGVVSIWSAYLVAGNNHGPPVLRRLSKSLSRRFTPWQTLVITFVWLYVARNFGKLIGLECPEPLANLYSRSYFRATWIATALDAGFWTAMPIKRPWLRNLSSLLFTIYYLGMAEQADEKVRKIRSIVTVNHLRVSWNKTTTPYLRFLTSLTRPRFMRYNPRAIRIPRPDGSAYSEPVHGWLYFDGPLSELKKQTKLVLNIPGGGFVAMSPRTHDDCLMAWAGKTKLPILSLDYRKAPEYPYPYALNECYDVYSTIHASHGRCVGLSGETIPSVVLSGDSAGGNLATGVTLMVLQAGSTEDRRWRGEQKLPTPAGLILTYPALDMNIGNWMSDEQMELIKTPGMRKTNKRVLSRKNSQYHMLDPSTPVQTDDDTSSDEESSSRDKSRSLKFGRRALSGIRTPPPPGSTKSTSKDSTLADSPGVPVLPAGGVKTRLAVPSLMSYVNDRMLTPEMMRAMIILYIGPHARPSFPTDYLLSPCLAPDDLLARFPKTYFLTGERDPLVDDTVIMAGRIRQARMNAWRQREDAGLLTVEERRRGWQEREWLTVKLVEGCSHGFLQLAGIFPEAWEYIHGIGRWYEDAFAWDEFHRRQAQVTRLRRLEAERRQQRMQHQFNHHQQPQRARNHTRSNTASSALSEDDAPLTMSAAGISEKLARSSPLQWSEQHAERAQSSYFDGHVDEPKSMLDEDANGMSLVMPEAPVTPGASRSRGKRRSVDTLASTDDLLARRMKGLAAGLTGNIEHDEGH